MVTRRLAPLWLQMCMGLRIDSARGTRGPQWVTVSDHHLSGWEPEWIYCSLNTNFTNVLIYENKATMFCIPYRCCLLFMSCMMNDVREPREINSSHAELFSRLQKIYSHFESYHNIPNCMKEVTWLKLCLSTNGHRSAALWRLSFILPPVFVQAAVIRSW